MSKLRSELNILCSNAEMLRESNEQACQCYDRTNHILSQVWDLAPWQDRALDYFLDLVGRWHPDLGHALSDVEPIMNIVNWAMESGRWTDVAALHSSGLTVKISCSTTNPEIVSLRSDVGHASIGQQLRN